ncbi:hypothetical protein [Bradyrhizobium sp. STM 3843]|uniref:hypothetical protein n=1 Tax=Bradyrhizobium sp. STM 3843 TaxID=551947 RepID=UPI001586C6FA|nr:hypothetical protein [Bradyrhizobium sp. STM 3843]
MRIIEITSLMEPPSLQRSLLFGRIMPQRLPSSKGSTEARANHCVMPFFRSMEWMKCVMMIAFESLGGRRHAEHATRVRCINYNHTRCRCADGSWCSALRVRRTG